MSIPLIFSGILGGTFILVILLLVTRVRLVLLLENEGKQVQVGLLGGTVFIVFVRAQETELKLRVFGRSVIRMTPGKKENRRPGKIQKKKKSQKKKRKGVYFWLSRDWRKLRPSLIQLVRDLQQFSFQGYIKLGLGSPALLGTLYGLYAMAQGILPGLADRFHLIPVFEEKVLEYRLELQAGFRPVTVMFHAANAYRIYRRIVQEK